MGRKGNWFSAVKKALNSEPKHDNNQPTEKSKKKWFKKKKRGGASATPPEITAPATSTAPPAPVQPSVVPHPELPNVSGVDKEPEKTAYTTPTVKPKKLREGDKEQKKHAHSVALATAKAAEATFAAAQAAAEVVRLASVGPVDEESNKEMAAIKVQTAFRGYMARRTLRALRGLTRLKLLMQGQTVKRQTANTLKCMQTLARMQCQIRERRLRMAEDNLAHQMKHKSAKEQAREFEKLQQSSDGWDSSGKTKAQIEAKLQSKHEAAIRRERTLAYAFSHQQTWKSSPRSGTTLFMDSNNPQWGWSWLERWLAAKPWENATMESSTESSPHSNLFAKDEILKSYAKRQTTEKPSPKSVPQKARSSNARLSTSSAPKLRSLSPKVSPRSSVWGPDNDDSSSMLSEKSVRDDESVASSVNVPTYMAPTEAAKARLRSTPDRQSVSSNAKKRVSRPPSPATSRRSSTSIADVISISDHT